MRLSMMASAAVALTMAVPARAVPADFQAKAEALLNASFSDGGPGAAVIVTDDGKTVYAAGQGLEHHADGGGGQQRPVARGVAEQALVDRPGRRVLAHGAGACPASGAVPIEMLR